MAQEIARTLHRRFRHIAAGIDDFEQMAAIGLLAAIRQYDPARGLRFERYAGPIIQHRIYDQLRQAGVISRPNRHDWGLVLMPLHAEQRRFGCAPGILDELIAREILERVRLLNLTLIEREVLEDLLEGRRYREIAARCGINEDRVSHVRTTLIAKIRRNLRSGPSPLRAAA
jgi:RNA polymerase sigma factor (sigma-70 family)